MNAVWDKVKSLGAVRLFYTAGDEGGTSQLRCNDAVSGPGDS